MLDKKLHSVPGGLRWLTRQHLSNSKQVLSREEHVLVIGPFIQTHEDQRCLVVVITYMLSACALGHSYL